MTTQPTEPTDHSLAIEHLERAEAGFRAYSAAQKSLYNRASDRDIQKGSYEENARFALESAEAIAASIRALKGEQ